MDNGKWSDRLPGNYNELQLERFDAWIRNRTSLVFNVEGSVRCNIKVEWLKEEPMDDCDGLAGFRMVCDLDPDNPMMIGSVDIVDGKADARTFVVEKVTIPGGNSWEIDAIMSGYAKLHASHDGVVTDSRRVNAVVNGFMRVAMRNVLRYGRCPKYVMCGEFVRQKMDAGEWWDPNNGPMPNLRWYYVPFGAWRRSQSDMDWFAQGWLKPIPVYGQELDQDVVLDAIEVDLDQDGNRITI